MSERIARLPAEVGDIVQFKVTVPRVSDKPADWVGEITQNMGYMLNGGNPGGAHDRAEYFRVHVCQSDVRLTLTRNQFHIVRKWNAPELHR